MKEFNTLTRAEMQIMNILWDKGCGMTTHEIRDNRRLPRTSSRLFHYRHVFEDSYAQEVRNIL